MKFIKPFYGCTDGAIYPVQFEKGDTVPPELAAAAIEAGAAKANGRSPNPAGAKVPDNPPSETPPETPDTAGEADQAQEEGGHD